MDSLRRTHRVAPLAAFAFCAVWACAPLNPPPPGPGPVWDRCATERFVVLAESLRAQWLRAERGGDARVEFLSPRAQVMRVEGESVYVFDYQDREARREEAETIEAGGRRIGGHRIAWEDEPRVFTRDTLIAIYAGDDEDVAAGLQRALGSPLGGSARGP